MAKSFQAAYIFARPRNTFPSSSSQEYSVYKLLHKLSSSLLHRNLLEWINSITLRIIQLQPCAILQCQTILLRIIQSASALPPTPELDLTRLLGSLDPEADVDAAVDLVDFALDPRVFRRKVYFVAEVLTHERVGAQGVEGGGYDGGFLLLVVEEGEEGDGHSEDEDGEGAENLRRNEGWDTVCVFD